VHSFFTVLKTFQTSALGVRFRG